jgi:lysophospholipase
MKAILIPLGLLFFWSLAFAVSENNLETDFETVILPFYKNQLQRGEFEGKGGVAISYAKLEIPDERGALVICSGRTESYIKYAEFMYDLRETGFSIYILDHRGQGFSGRMLDDPQKGHVERFEDYDADLKTFLDTVVNARDHAKRFILAHSMGGTIAVMYAVRHPEDLDGLILSSPMLEINTSPLPRIMASLIANTMTVVGMGGAYVPGGGSYKPDKPFEENDVTHSEARYTMARKLVSLHPQIAMGAPTNRWLRESLKAVRQARESAAELGVPVLALQAEMDVVTGPEVIDEFCGNVRDCARVVLTGARHEILMETDEIRDKALASILDFLNTRS